MGDSTGISWTDASWNPIRGCSRVSEGCRHCYAERVAARFSGPGQPYEGLARRKLTIVNNEEHDPGNQSDARWTGEVRLISERLADPLRWKKPRRIFVNSMSDLFHEKLSNEQIAAVFGVMAAATQHTFQVLTKRAKRMREWFAWLDAHVEADAEEWSGRDCATNIHAASDACRLEYLDETASAALAGHYDVCHLGLTTSKNLKWPLRHVWLGVSVENQAAADERIPDLIATPAAVRFLSCEPLLGEVSLGLWLVGATAHKILRDHGASGPVPQHLQPPTSIDWIIGGCESGPGARPCDVAWLRSLRNQCAIGGVAFFLKQAREDIERCMEGCGEVVRYRIDKLGNCDAACKCTTKGAESCNAVGICEGPGSKRKARGVIELPYLDGIQHANFPGAAR